jgi:integrase-like protein
VTHLRKAMLEELQRRNLSPITTRIYLHAVEEFALYYNQSPDRLGLEHIRQKTNRGRPQMESLGNALVAIASLTRVKWQIGPRGPNPKIEDIEARVAELDRAAEHSKRCGDIKQRQP